MSLVENERLIWRLNFRKELGWIVTGSAVAAVNAVFALRDAFGSSAWWALAHAAVAVVIAFNVKGGCAKLMKYERDTKQIIGIVNAGIQAQNRQRGES